MVETDLKKYPTWFTKTIFILDSCTDEIWVYAPPLTHVEPVFMPLLQREMCALKDKRDTLRILKSHTSKGRPYTWRWSHLVPVSASLEVLLLWHTWTPYWLGKPVRAIRQCVHHIGGGRSVPNDWYKWSKIAKQWKSCQSFMVPLSMNHFYIQWLFSMYSHWIWDKGKETVQCLCVS